ncbi:MAG: hypothetical protein Q7J34_04235 [Bacteroidales bacterium]|nr:hypothetical protein [Bacteroidales bacterium]
MTQKLKYERPHIKKLESEMPTKFGAKTNFKPVKDIDGVPIDFLVKDYGSPLFVISEKTLRETFRSARKAFETRYPRVQFAWSYKTNYHGAVCRAYHQEGSWAEVVSGFEYEKALRNGVPGDKIIFNGPDKTEADLEKAIAHGSLIHIDHSEEFYTIVSLCDRMKEKPRVAIRVNMDTNVYPMWDRFGFNYENGQAQDILNKIMRSGKMDLVGLHCHIGTFMFSANAYGIAASKLANLAMSLKRKYNHSIRYIDLGGGFASQNTLKGSFLPGIDSNPGFDEYAEAISTALLNSELPSDNLPLLILETGRALIDDAGYLISSVIANKRTSTGKRITVLDVGVNSLFTSFWYDHKIIPAQDFTKHAEETTLYGPLCMNIDVIREHISLPLLNKGEKVVIHQVGAYNMTQWMQFITLRPAIVMVGLDGKSYLIRQAEEIDNVIGPERIPEHLSQFDL